MGKATTSPLGSSGRSGGDIHQILGAHAGRRLVENAVDQRVDGGVAADADCHEGNGGGAETRGALEDAQAGAEVGPELLEVGAQRHRRLVDWWTPW